MSSSSSLRALLPHATVPDSQSLAEVPSESPVKKRKTLRAGHACLICHKRKVACDGVRPTCGSCRKNSLVCEYSGKQGETPNESLRRELDVMRQRQVEFQDFLSMLSTSSKAEVERTLDQLRSHADPLSILESYKNPSLTSYQPRQSTSAGLKELGFYSVVDINLAAQVSILFPPPSKIDERSLIEALLRSETTTNTSPYGDGDRYLNYELDLSNLSAESESDVMLSNKRSISMIPDTLEISTWTTVQASGGFVARVLTFFMETTHPILGLFDPPEYIHGLISKECDPGAGLLFNALLAFACQAYSSLEPIAYSRSFEFEKEAVRLWHANRTCNTNKHIAGLVFLSASLSNHDDWNYVQECHIELTNLARARGLFDDVQGLEGDISNELHGAERKSLAYLAWGVFNYTIMTAMFYLNDLPNHTPRISIDSSLQEDMNLTFQAFCGFCSIANQILFVYRPTMDRKPPLAFVLTQFNNLISFINQLPPMMTASKHSKVDVIVFHIWVHVFILDIFRPFLVDRARRRVPQEFDEQTMSTPDAICAASARQLKHLILLYQLFHEKTNPTTFYHVGLLYLMNWILKDTEDPDRQLYVLMCIRAYQRFGQAHVIGIKTLQGLLVMAVKHGVITVSEARAMMEDRDIHTFPISKSQSKSTTIRGKIRKRKLPRNNEPGHDTQAKPDDSHEKDSPPGKAFMLDLDRGIGDRQSARLGALAQEFQDLELFDEFTEGLIE